MSFIPWIIISLCLAYLVLETINRVWLTKKVKPRLKSQSNGFTESEKKELSNSSELTKKGHEFSEQETVISSELTDSPEPSLIRLQNDFIDEESKSKRDDELIKSSHKGTGSLKSELAEPESLPEELNEINKERKALIKQIDESRPNQGNSVSDEKGLGPFVIFTAIVTSVIVLLINPEHPKVIDAAVGILDTAAGYFFLKLLLK